MLGRPNFFPVAIILTWSASALTVVSVSRPSDGFFPEARISCQSSSLASNHIGRFQVDRKHLFDVERQGKYG